MIAQKARAIWERLRDVSLSGKPAPGLSERHPTDDPRPRLTVSGRSQQESRARHRILAQRSAPQESCHTPSIGHPTTATQPPPAPPLPRSARAMARAPVPDLLHRHYECHARYYVFIRKGTGVRRMRLRCDGERLRDRRSAGSLRRRSRRRAREGGADGNDADKLEGQYDGAYNGAARRVGLPPGPLGLPRPRRGCTQITDAAMVHLVGIHTINMRGC